MSIPGYWMDEPGMWNNRAPILSAEEMEMLEGME